MGSNSGKMAVVFDDGGMGSSISLRLFTHCFTPGVSLTKKHKLYNFRQEHKKNQLLDKRRNTTIPDTFSDLSLMQDSFLYLLKCHRHITYSSFGILKFLVITSTIISCIAKTLFTCIHVFFNLYHHISLSYLFHLPLSSLLCSCIYTMK